MEHNPATESGEKYEAEIVFREGVTARSWSLTFLHFVYKLLHAVGIS
jgi:hypothetical protein